MGQHGERDADYHHQSVEPNGGRGVAGELIQAGEVFEAERSWLFGLAYRLFGVGV